MPRQNSSPTNPPEFEILLAVARAQVTGDLGNLPALLERAVDWDRLFSLSLAHKMVPLLYWHLLQTGRYEVPPDAARRIKEAFQSNAAWNLILTGELCRIAALFDAEGIPVIPYKGPALASLLYGNLALRQCSDLDLLIRERDVAHARSVLAENGYDPGIKLEASQARAILLSECDQTFGNKSLRIALELHWAVVPPYYCFPLDTVELIARSGLQNLSGYELRTLCAEDQLLVLCVHASKGMWQSLEWTCGIAVVASRLSADQLQNLLSRARGLGTEHILLVGLRLCQLLVGLDLPIEIEPLNRIDLLARRVIEKLPGPLPDIALLTRFRLAVRERWTDRVRYCWRRGVRPTYKDVAVVKLRSDLFFFYYVIRPFRLLRTALTDIVKS